MKALIILDVQHGILSKRDFSTQKDIILKLGERFNDQQLPIYLIKHINKEGTFLTDRKEIEIDKDIAALSSLVIEKSTPSAFYQTDLYNQLISNHIKELVIVGFNIEYCVLFTAISAYERGFKVHVIEDACGTTNDETTYEMKNLDISDFIGSVMNWSNVIDVHYYDEYLQLDD